MPLEGPIFTEGRGELRGSAREFHGRACCARMGGRGPCARHDPHEHKSIDRVRKSDVGSTKTETARRVPIEPELLPLLRVLHERAGGKGPVVRLLWWPNTRSTVTRPSNSGDAGRRLAEARRLLLRSVFRRHARPGHRRGVPCGVGPGCSRPRVGGPMEKMPLAKHDDVIQ